MYIRKTTDVWIIKGYYPGSGWNEETAEDTRLEAKNRLREYRENCPGTSFCMVKRREPKA